MSYVVLARKWRPMRFEDLVGQDHVARTLGNAIDAGRVAHAFLFTGVRGVGKTTSARILAKALNCMREPGTLEEGAPDPGPTVTPCLKCPACLEIAEGRDMDVQEIDGASYNGVDEVRKLQDSLPYRPNRDRYKVVIVDEVHMLSNAAWNAFLKTLEEPPPHVKFIFATTEVHKVPITILSRVQRFDFKMIPTRLIMERLRWVLDQEGLQSDDTALGILARQAAGSMRDAMSLLDQVIAFSGENLSGDDVARVLGVASRGALLELAHAVVDGDQEKCLSIVGTLADQGFDIPHVTRDILALLRDLVVAKVCKNPQELLDLADEEREEVLKIAGKTSDNDLLRLHTGFSKGYDDVVRSVDPRAGLEMLLVRLALRPPLLPIDELLHRIGNLEKRLTQGGAAPARRRPTGGGGGPGRDGDRPPAQRPRDRAPQTQASSGPATNEEDDAGPARPTPAADPQANVSHPNAPPRDFHPNAPPQDFHPNAPPQDSHPGAPPQDFHPNAPPQDFHPNAPPQDSHPGAPTQDFHPNAPPQEPHQKANPAQVAPPAPPQPEPAPKPVAKPSAEPGYKPSENEVARLAIMMKLTDRVRENNQEIAAYLEQTVPLQAGPRGLELGLEKGHVFQKQIISDRAQEVLKEALAAEFGEGAELKITTDCREATPAKTVSAERVRQRRAAELAAIEEVKAHPRVQEAVAIFNAHVKHVSLGEAH